MTSQLGPTIRPIGCVTQGEHQDREDAQEADDGDDRKLDALAAKDKRQVNGYFEFARAQRIVETQRDQGEEDERITRRRTECVEVG